MPTTPTPADEVPDFIIERFAKHEPETLRAIAEYAEIDNPRKVDGEVPEYVIPAFKIQDSNTVAACAIYATELAQYIDHRRAEKQAAKSEQAETDDDDDSDDGAPIMGGSFFG